MGVGGQRHAPSASPRTHCTGDWVGHKAALSVAWMLSVRRENTNAYWKGLSLHASSLNIKKNLMLLSTGVYTKNFRLQISVPGPATVTRWFVIFLTHSKSNIRILPQIMIHSSLPYPFQFLGQWHARHSTVTSHSMTSWQRLKKNYMNATSPDWTSGVRFTVGAETFLRHRVQTSSGPIQPYM